MSSAGNDDGTQWTRPTVQPQDIVEMLVGPLSVARGTYGGVNTSASVQQQMAPPQARHKSANKPPKSNKKRLPPYAHPNPLLTRRVWRLQEYITDFHTRPKGPKKYRPGELPMPIPVPLRYGEKFHEYEARFVTWLAKKNIRLSDLQGDPNHERSLRTNFANMRVATPTGQPLPGLEVSLADNSSFQPQLSLSKPRKRDRSESPPASHKRSARVVLQEIDSHCSELSEPPRKIHLQREKPSPSSVRSTSSSLSSHVNQKGKFRASPQLASAPYHSVEAHTIAAAVPPSPIAPPSSNAAPKTVSPAKADEQCVAKLPGARAPMAAFIVAYVSCNCRQCMQDWNLMLTDRLSALENEMRSMRELQLQQANASDKREHSQQQAQQQQSLKAAKQEDAKTQSATKLETVQHKGEKAVSKNPIPQVPSDSGEWVAASSEKTVVTTSVEGKFESRSASSNGHAADEIDETSDTEDTCSSKSGGAEPLSKALPNVTAKAATSAAPASSISSSSAIRALTGDPIKAHMVDEYNALNGQILLNEKVMADSLQRVQTTMLADMAGAMQEHQQIQQIQVVIQSDVASRNKALAILIAYCWVYKQEELFEQISKLGTLNIAHVQGVSHAKCASFAAQIESKHEFLLSLKEMLDQIILTGGSSSNGSNGDGNTLSNCGIDELNGLGRQIVLEEQALAALEQERMDEFMRLFQFSHDIRTSCRAILDGSGSEQ